MISRPVTITIDIMREANLGLSYWVYINRDDGEKVCPYKTYQMDQAIVEASMYANFFGLEAPKLVPMEDMGLTQEMIDAGYKEAEIMLEFEEFKYGKKS